MAKVVFGEFSAYTTPGGIRFMKNNRLTSESSVPVEVVNYLRQKLGDDSTKVVPASTEQPKFPRPSEEELARMRAESVASLTGQPGDEVKTLEQPTPIGNEDFDTPDIPDTTLEPPAEIVSQVEEHVAEHEAKVDSNFLESVSIHTADLKDIAQALYERFGIYTVYLGTLPQADEINPLTATAFTKYHLGIAYQAAIYAQNQGLLEREPEMQRRNMDAGREASANFKVDPVAHTMRESRQANDFNYRTSVRGTQTQATTRIEHLMGEDGQLHAVQVPIPASELGDPNFNGAGQRYDKDEDEQIVEPPMSMGVRPVIRPNW